MRYTEIQDLIRNRMRLAIFNTIRVTRKEHLKFVVEIL